MSDKPPELAVDPLPPTSEESKEMTDKIHRLVRRFSKELVELIYREIGARKIIVKGKPGPKPGYKFRRNPCPLCGLNENSYRRFGFICRDCRAGKEIGHRTKMKEAFPQLKRRKKDKWGRDFKVTVRVPKHLPVKPETVEVPDSEPDFLDRLIEVVPDVQPKAEQPKKASDDVDFFS